VLQETFLRLWQHRHRFDVARAIEAWAWVIARNAAVDLLRRRSRTTPATPLLEAVADRRAVEPGGELAAAEEHQAFVKALKRETNPLVRRVLELRLVAGLSYAAVCQATGVPVGTVATWLGRLRRSLRNQALWAA
jgi:RNA polymerase sigma-70 factor (ECF subfamily)